MSSFTHLHVHSNYSLREGAARVDELATAASSFGMEALALTDHDGMYGAVRFTQACKQFGVRPILGAEIEWGEGYHIVLLAKDAVGWSNLCKLVTEMHLSERAQTLPPGKRPRTSFESLSRHSDGLIALSGCNRGEVPWLAGLGRTDEAEEALRRCLDVFGTENFAVELSNHLAEEDPIRIQRLRELACSVGVTTVATNNVHYPTRDDAPLHDVLDCIRRIVPLNRATAPRSNSELYLKSSEEMTSIHPPEALAGVHKIAQMCAFELPLGEFHFPDLPPERGGADINKGESSTSILARRCYEGLRSRFTVVNKKVETRLQDELRAIRKGGFCGYFLLVADIVEVAKKKLGIRCACRGSAAGSLVAYALHISDVDPVRHDLVFERFMNEYRREIPDIDVDFESARREEVITYILESYPGRSAMVAMMETFRARAALREVGKALGLAQSEVDIVAKAFPHISATSIRKAITELPEVAEVKLSEAKLDLLFDLASKLDGYPRHLALHPSGMILSDSSLENLMPMQMSFDGHLMSQFDKDDVEALGLAKLDVLGVRMLSAMSHTLDEIERVRGFRPNIDEIPLDDKPTFDLIRDSKTLGCFQIESPGQRELLGKFQPTAWEDLIIDISLFRPGPVKSDMVVPYLERRHGFAPVEYPHRMLAPILRETNGVIVYHEQVMRVIAALTGCDLPEADKIRRQLDNTIGPEQEALRDNVVLRAVERGWKKVVAEKVWDDVLQFASFGFCKAHAAAFAVPTYQSAWLKAHYLAEFYCGVLTHDPGMYPRRAILADARAHGVPILSVDVNFSGANYIVDGNDPSRGGIRLALKDVRRISDPEIDEIIKGRPWRSFDDFCDGARVDRPVIEALVHCGGFDSMKGKRSRRELYWSIRERWAARTLKEESQLQLPLSVPEQIRLPGIADYTEKEKVEAELEVLGLDASAHLISFFKDQLERLGWTPASELAQKKGNSTVVVAGVKVATQTPPMKSGKRVVFLTLDDGTGQADVTLFQEAQAKYARRVFDGWILAVKGVVRRTGEKGVSVLGEEVIDLKAPTNGFQTGLKTKLWHASGGSAG